MKAALGRRVRVLAWASLVAQILIVGTGGAVRLTGSGLGCPTWPRCTPESFVSTPEMGIHGVIEFGNRLLTFVLIIIAIAMFVSVVRLRKERPDLFRLSLAIGLGIPGQGVIGGITVLTNLNPWVVGLHFVLSVVLVSLATVLVYRVYHGLAGRSTAVPPLLGALIAATAVVASLTIALGIITTGSGPHAGDGGAARNGLDSELLQHFHAWPAYATFAGTIAVLVWSLRLALPRLTRFASLLLAVEFVQIAVGLAQARLGLPEILVGIHMVLSVCLAAAMTAVILASRSDRAAADAAPSSTEALISA